MTKTAAKSPVRGALREDSSLQASVRDGLGALKAKDRNCFDTSIRADFADSLDLDDAMKAGRERENRWDYLLGHAKSGKVVAVEPHSAINDEISTVIRKRTAAREQLMGHLRDGAKIAKWLWVTEKKVHFADTEKIRRLLDQNGIDFVGTKVMAKHLPSADEATIGGKPGRKKAKPGR